MFQPHSLSAAPPKSRGAVCCGVSWEINFNYLAFRGISCISVAVRAWSPQSEAVEEGWGYRGNTESSDIMEMTKTDDRYVLGCESGSSRNAGGRGTLAEASETLATCAALRTTKW